MACLVGGLDGKESACNVRDLGLITGLGRCPGKGCGYPLQCSCLENSMDKRTMAGYSPWDCKELDTAEQLTLLIACFFYIKLGYMATTNNLIVSLALWNDGYFLSLLIECKWQLGLASLSSVLSLSHIGLFATSWTAACQASLSITAPGVYPNPCPWSRWCHTAISFLCRPILFLPSVFPRMRVFSNELILPIRWPNYWSFNFSISPSSASLVTA